MKKQRLENQRGEIEFRKKLYQQQVEGKPIFEDEYQAADVERILGERMGQTLRDMSDLQRRGIPISPYIEFGAERGQRSLVMENDLGAQGAALDITYDLLKACGHYQGILKKPRTPLRICCDANTLPFESGSIPFVFCYETLHHFPEPAPITQEVFRVLSPGGYFFFDEEPLRQLVHFNLYKAKKSNSSEYISRSVVRKVCDKLFMERSLNETDHGALENDQITLTEWKTALAGYETKDVRLEYGPVKTQLLDPKSRLKHLALYLFGGNVSGICRKPGQPPTSDHRTIEERLVCPSCRQNSTDASLRRSDSAFTCTKCSKIYPVVDGVLFLFAYEKFEVLYPEVFSSFVAKMA